MSNNIQDLSPQIQELVTELQNIEDLKEGLRDLLVSELQSKRINKKLNVLLVSRLIKKMSIEIDEEYEDDIDIDDIEEILEDADWEQREDDVNLIKEFCVFSLSFLGRGFQSLFAQGIRISEEASTASIAEYLKEAQFLGDYAWRIVLYSLLSELWVKKLSLSGELKAALQGYFEANNGRNTLSEHLGLIKQLVSEHQDFRFAAALRGVAFDKLIKHADKMTALSDTKGDSTIVEAFEMEVKLSHLLKPLMFLQDYDLVSVKNVLYKKLYQLEAEYVFKPLLVSSMDKTGDLEQKPQAVSNNSVLLVEKSKKNQLEDSQSTINLTPFIFDNCVDKEDRHELLYYAFRRNKSVTYSYVDLLRQKEKLKISLVKPNEVLHQEMISTLVKLFIQDILS